jgi:hypothetical protein
MKNALKVCIAVVLSMCSVAWAAGLSPLPSPKPQEPLNKKDVSKFGDVKDIKADGYFLFPDQAGLMISPIGAFAPVAVPDTPPQPNFLDISDDGRWIIFSTNDKGYLIRPDGTGKTELPISPRPGNKKRPGAAVGLYHHGPLGDEVVFIPDDQTIQALAVDLSGDKPTFGKTRVLVDCSKMSSEKMGLGSQQEGRFTVAADHVLVCINAHASMITIPDGGKGTASSPKDIFDRRNPPTWECGSAMSHNGELVAQNPGGGDKNVIPVEIGHKGPVVYPFMLPTAAPLDVKSQLYAAKAVGICWVPESVRNVEGDWHHWYFSNDPAYLIGTSQGQRNLGGSIDQFKGIGIYLLHWPSGVYYRISDEKTRARFMACHFFRPETKASIKLPAGFGKGGAKAAAATPASQPAAASGRPADKPASAPAADRKLVLEVTAVELSPVPAAKEIGVYKHISRFIRYDVNKVVSGKYDGKSIVIGHWSVRDSKLTDAAAYKAGDKFTITCEPLDAQSDITLAQQMDTIDDLRLPRYWAIAAQVRK